MVKAKVSATARPPMATPSPAAASEPERISQRVPMTSVSYSTTMPRKNGARANRFRCRMLLRGSWAPKICPSGPRTATPMASRPRIRTPSMSAWPP